MSALISANEILATDYATQEFIIGPKLLPKGGCMLIGAATGVGKSWVALHIAQCFVTGEPLFNAHYHKHGQEGLPKFPVAKLNKIIYIDYELSHATRKERLQPNLPSNSGLYFPTTPTQFGLDTERIVRLSNLVKLERPDLLIIDPLSSAHMYEENSNQIKHALNRVDDIRSNGCAVILVHHASSKPLRDRESKAVPRLPIEMFRGHSSIVDWADLAISLYPGGEKEEGLDEGATKKALRLYFAKIRHNEHRKPVSLTVDYKKCSVGEDISPL